ncbi:MAG: insulinase family protein [Melioribacteraceae bacterium]|nr:insulinase family protein [Melioribacteraceae bacterium]MCF8356297.1 insulinase family protein [Melioribacteraceae bacterium]MCF8393546.1 insulinase family protein [Melioribacteraceae bacterium]MCF8419356.1 insulinase family protein [Melioribacteraceae bacterium]
MQNIQISELKNGIKVISEHIPYVQSFSLGFWFNVGSRDENEANNGISHFIEHMLFKGTKKRSAKRIADDIESHGGYLNAFTSKEHTCYYGRGLYTHLEKTFGVLADMIQNSVFKSSEIAKEASVIIDEMNDINDSPEELIFDKFETNIFNGNSLSKPIIGNEKNIRKLGKKDFQKYIEQHYHAGNMLIVASGKIDHNKLLKLSQKYFDEYITGKPADRKKVECKPVEDLFVYKDIQQAHLIIGALTDGYTRTERNKASVLTHILGEGSSSRLFQIVREKHGIAYQINTFLNSFSDISTFGIYFSTNDKSVEKAQQLINNEFNKIKKKHVSERELKRAKEYITGSIIMSMENTTNRMLRVAHSIIYYGRIKTLDETLKEINSVTKEDIIKLSNKILDDKVLNRVVISSKNHLLHSAA